ncbi:PAS domain S-box protein [Phormidesmis sp. 146-12]
MQSHEKSEELAPLPPARSLTLADPQPDFQRSACESEQCSTMDELTDELTHLKVALAESEDRYRRLFEHSPQPMWIYDPETLAFLAVNEAAIQHYGYTREAFLDMTILNICPIEEVPHLIEQLQSSALAPTNRRHRKQNGTLIEVKETTHEESFWGRRSYVVQITDMTEAKRNEVLRKHTEDQLRQRSLVFDRIYDGVILTNLQGEILDWNPGAERIFGYSKTEMLGRTPGIIHPPESATQLTAEILNGVTTTGYWQGEIPFIHKNGSQGMTETIVVPFSDDQGNPMGTLGVNHDITERKQAELALQLNRQRLDLVLKSTELGLWYCDLPFDKLEWSDQCRSHFWLSPDTDVTIDLFYKCLHPDDREPTRQAIATSLEEKSDYTIDYRTVSPMGQIRWIRAIGRGFYDQEGNPTRFDGVTVDITSQKQAEVEREQMLNRSQQYTAQLHGLTEAALVMNSALSVDEVLKTITEQARSIIGAHQSVTSLTANQNWAQSISAVSLSDKYAAWRDYKEPADGSGIYACVCHLNRPMRLTQTELEAHPGWKGFGAHAADHPPMRGWLAAPLTGRDGHNIGLIQLSDKTVGEFTSEDEAILVQLAQMSSVAIENARLYAAEQQARAQAESANRIKDEFLAVLSHELRTPLNPILGWAKLLQTRTFDGAKTTEALMTIERNARLQAQLIEDLLDVSRILRGKLILNVAPVNVRTIVTAALETVRLAAEAKAIELHYQADNHEPHPSPLTVLGDLTRLQQIVWNLLSNAVKFTPPGGRVEVLVEQIEGMAQIRVIDTGKGISPEFLPYIFDYFRQADSATTRQHGGLGLGLAIARQLVELHGGTLWAESLGEDKGTTFTVKLPLLKQDTMTNPELTLRPLGDRTQENFSVLPLAGLQILVVDDDADSRDFVTFVLEQEGADVMAVSSAVETLKTLAYSQPNLLISDIGMPEMDGYMLMRQIRTLLPGRKSQIPAIALTAYAGEYDQQQALSAGFQAHITKPTDPDQLVAIVAQLAQSGMRDEG